MYEQIVSDGENKSVFSCEIDRVTKYGTAADFTTENIGSATKITLLDNFTAPDHTEIKISSNCTLDLAGKTLTFTGETYRAGQTVTNLGSAFTVAADKTCTISSKFVVSDGATFTLVDSNGGGQIANDDSVKATNNWPTYAQSVIHVGTGTGENAKFIMDGGTIKAGDNGINIKGKAVAIVNGGTVDATGNCAVFTLDDCKGSDDHFNFEMNGGTLTTSSVTRATIQSQGSSLAYIKLNGGKVIRTDTPFQLPPAAIYASYVGKIVVSGTAYLTSVTSGIEIRMGELEVTGGKIESTADKYTLYPFNSGETNTGSAISVDQHNSQRKIKVTISGGEICGPVALSTANPQRNINFGEPAETVSPKSGGETVDGKKVVGTVSIDITGGTFRSTSTDTERKITSERVQFTYNNKAYDVTKYTFTGKNAIFNADDRLDISISNATIEGDLATITDNRGMETISKPRISQNGGYIVADDVTFVGISATPKDYSNLISYALDEDGDGIVIPEGWNYFDGWKGMVTDKDGFSKIALYVDDTNVSLSSLKFDPVNRVFAIAKGTKAQWSGQFANGGGSYYLAEFDYDKDATAVTVSSETAGAVISGGNSGILSNKVKRIEADLNSVALSIVGNSLDNTLAGGKGNDSLTGGGGKNLFIYRAGEDLITDYTISDKVSLDTLNPVLNAVSVTTAENNLVLNFDDKNKLAFAGFASLTAQETRPTAGISIQSDKNTYVYTAYSVADMTKGKPNGVTLNSAAGSEFNAPNSFVTIDGSAVDVENFAITGNQNNNSIVGGKRGGMLNGGAGDDTLKGGGGENTFVYTAGKDVIENYTDGDKVDLNAEIFTAAKSFGNKLTFSTANKDNALTFNFDYEPIEKISLTADDMFLTKDGVINSSTLKLFSSASGEINLAENALYGGISGIDASAVRSQNLTLVGGAGGEFTFSKNNKADVFVHKGGRDTVKNYEVGKDKISIEDGLADFSVADNNVTLRLNDGSELVLESVAGAEVNLHDDEHNNHNQYSKKIFAADGVLKDKVAATSVTLYAGAFAGGYDATTDKKVKSIHVAENVTGATSITGNAQNNVIDVSKISIGGDSGFTLGGGLGNDKITGSGKADLFVYTGGKDIIGYSSGDSISIGDRDLSAATISKNKNGVVFKFNSKDAITVKSGEKIFNIGDASYSFGKNAIITDGSASLTSNFSGTYTLSDGAITAVDGGAAKKNLSLKGMKNHGELLIGGGKKTKLHGNGGDDTLQGGAGVDTFFYSKGDSGAIHIANFEGGRDKIKINGSKVIQEISTSGNFGLTMTNGATVEFDDKTVNDVLIKANNTYYWFEAGGWVTSTDKISNSAAKNSDYTIVELGYSTNLVKADLAHKGDDVTFSFDLQRFNAPIEIAKKSDGLYAGDTKLKLKTTNDASKPCEYYELDGASYIIKESIELDHPIWVSGTTNINIAAGATLSKDNSVKYEDHVIAVKRGAILTLDGAGTISYTGELNGIISAGCGVKMTVHTEPSGDCATLIVNGNLTIEGPSYGIAGNGGRHDTAITINGGNVRSTSNDKDSAGIYNSQDGSLTINGGIVTGYTSGIEIRSGSLTVTGGTVRSVAEDYSFSSNSGGAATKGAGVSVAQHTSKKNITVNISGGNIYGPIALAVVNPENNGAFSNSVGTVSVTITGGNFKTTGTDAERKIVSEAINYNNKDLTQYTFVGRNAIFNADGRVDISISNATIEGNIATLIEGRTTENGGYIIDNENPPTFVNTFTTPKDYGNFLSYVAAGSDYGIIVPEGWSYFNGWKGVVPVGNKIGAAALGVYGRVLLEDLEYDSDNKVFAIPSRAVGTWSSDFANGGGSYYLAELNYNTDKTSVEVWTTTAGAVIRGGSSGVLNDKVKKIDASDSRVALAIEGNALDNTINGGKGDDTLTGGAGADVFGYNGGSDIITDYTFGDLINLDTKIFDPVTDESKVRNVDGNIIFDFDGKNFLEVVNGLSSGVSIKSGNKLYIYDENSIAEDKSITLRSNFAAAAYTPGRYNTINGAAVDVENFAITGNHNDNSIVGGKRGGMLNGGAGDDTLKGSGGENTFVYTAGKDVIENYTDGDKVDLNAEIFTAAKIFGNKLTFSTARKDNALTFNFDYEPIEKISLTADNTFLTKDGVINSSTLKLFSSASGEINLAENALYGGISGIDATAVKKQNLTLIGGAGGEFTFSKNNKADVFVHKGGRDTIKNYEVGKDKISLEDGLADFFVAGNNVTLRLSDGSELVLESVAGAEVILHDDEHNNHNQYSKKIFAADGVLKDKVAATSVTLYAGAFANGYDATTDKKVKSIHVAENVTGATSITGNAQNNVIDVSKIAIGGDNGFTLGGGLGNDKITGSSKADLFVYTGGKDIIGCSSSDSISIGERDLTAANISKNKNGVVFKFSGKDALTVKSNEKIFNIGGTSYSFGKNAIITDGSASLTSNFSGTYTLSDGAITAVDGGAVKKNLSLKGMKNHGELLIAGGKKCKLHGNGGDDTLQGGAGVDTFFYSKGDSGAIHIAGFEGGKDKIKISGSKVIKEISTSGNFGFTMTNGATMEFDDKAVDDVLIKANNTYYWFEAGDWVTSTDKISNSAAKNSGYTIVELGYSTNLVKAGLAYKGDEILFTAKT